MSKKIFIEETKDLVALVELLDQLEKATGKAVQYGRALVVHLDDKAAAPVQALLEMTGYQINQVVEPQPEPAAPAPVEAKPANKATGKICAYCGKPTSSSRSKTCGSAECESAKRRETNQAYKSKKRTDTFTHLLLPAAQSYEVIAGSRTGEHMTSEDVSVALKIGTLQAGDMIRHDKRGTFRVVLKTGKDGSRQLTMAKVA